MSVCCLMLTNNIFRFQRTSKKRQKFIKIDFLNQHVNIRIEIQEYRNSFQKTTAFITHQVLTCLQGLPILRSLKST